MPFLLRNDLYIVTPAFDPARPHFGYVRYDSLVIGLIIDERGTIQVFALCKRDMLMFLETMISRGIVMPHLEMPLTVEITESPMADENDDIADKSLAADITKMFLDACRREEARRKRRKAA